MHASLALLLAFAIGIVAGLRSMTAPAVTAWAAHLGRLNLQNSALAFMGSMWAAGIFTLAALGELVADKLPMTPARTKPGPLAGRSVMGGLAEGAWPWQRMAPCGLGPSQVASARSWAHLLAIECARDWCSPCAYAIL